MKRIAVVFGASSFLGLHLISHMAKKGWYLRLADSHPNNLLGLKTAGQVGQIVPMHVNLNHEISIRSVMQNASCVVNLIEASPVSFFKKNLWYLNCNMAKKISIAASRENIQKVMHLSSMTSPNNTSYIALSKNAGEYQMRKHCPHAIIIRPNIMFGYNDHFLSCFSHALRKMPMLFVFCGYKKIAPVYVENVAKGMTLALDKKDSAGKNYSFYGPQHLTFTAITHLIAHTIQSSSAIIPLNNIISYILSLFCGIMPGSPINKDLVSFFKNGLLPQNDSNDLTLYDLGITEPTAIKSVIKQYISKYQIGGPLKMVYNQS